jgi:hypothetical protein
MPCPEPRGDDEAAAQSLADFITTRPGFRFSVHTGVSRNRPPCRETYVRLAQPMMQERSIARDRLTSFGFDSPGALVAWTVCLGTSIRLLFAASAIDLGYGEAFSLSTLRP